LFADVRDCSKIKRNQGAACKIIRHKQPLERDAGYYGLFLSFLQPPSVFPAIFSSFRRSETPRLLSIRRGMQGNGVWST
jgi:hypothetical protein